MVLSETEKARRKEQRKLFNNFFKKIVEEQAEKELNDSRAEVKRINSFINSRRKEIRKDVKKRYMELKKQDPEEFNKLIFIEGSRIQQEQQGSNDIPEIVQEVLQVIKGPSRLQQVEDYYEEQLRQEQRQQKRREPEPIYQIEYEAEPEIIYMEEEEAEPEIILNEEQIKINNDRTKAFAELSASRAKLAKQIERHDSEKKKGKDVKKLEKEIEGLLSKKQVLLGKFTDLDNMLRQSIYATNNKHLEQIKEPNKKPKKAKKVKEAKPKEKVKQAKKPKQDKKGDLQALLETNKLKGMRKRLYDLVDEGINTNNKTLVKESDKKINDIEEKIKRISTEHKQHGKIISADLITINLDEDEE